LIEDMKARVAKYGRTLRFGFRAHVVARYGGGGADGSGPPACEARRGGGLADPPAFAGQPVGRCARAVGTAGRSVW
jgi:hypothetical protein